MHYVKNSNFGTANELPKNSIEISEQKYKECIERISGGEKVTVVDGEVVFYKKKVHVLIDSGRHAGTVEERPDGEPLILQGPPEDLHKPAWDEEKQEWYEDETEQEKNDRLERERKEKIPSPSQAMKEIVAYYASLNQDASNPTKAGRIQLNNLLSAYPGAQGALQAGEYDELTGQGGYLEIAVEDTDLPDFDSSMRSDIEDILAGETSYL